MAFYSQIPGAVLERHRPGRLAIFRIGKGRIGLLQLPGRGFHVEIETTDVDGMYEQVKQAGCKVGRPLADRPWGERDFTIFDPDGNMVEFAAPASKAP